MSAKSVVNIPAPRLQCYSRESAIAEKFEAMVKLRELNSRMKDFYDIWMLSRQFDFEGEKLAKAVRLTLDRRGTTLPAEIVAFSERFIIDKQVQWQAFTRKLKQEHLLKSFDDVAFVVKMFLGPIASAVFFKTLPPDRWEAPGPWRGKGDM